jgi:hypothetical protein
MLFNWATVLAFLLWIGPFLAFFVGRQVKGGMSDWDLLHSLSVLSAFQLYGVVLLFLGNLETSFDLLNRGVSVFFLAQPISRPQYLGSIFIAAVTVILIFLGLSRVSILVVSWFSHEITPWTNWLLSDLAKASLASAGLVVHLFLSVCFANRMFSMMVSSLTIVFASYYLPGQYQLSLFDNSESITIAVSVLFTAALFWTTQKVFERKDIT